MTPDSFQAPSLEELAPLFPNYRMEAFIAQGGMGAVYLATQVSLDRQVAIKILPREFGADEEFRDSFAAEAKAMAKLNHPNLIGVYDFGEADGMPFIVMEYVAGKSLHDSSYGKQIDPLEAARIATETLRGLQHAHEHNVLHRDVKPANILLEPTHAEAKLGDFGLAMPSNESNEEASIIGTPGYAAPEVYAGQPDARSDVYAGAVILYQLLTGQLPGDPYQHPSALAPCDRRFDSLLAKALQPDPNDRHQSAAELAEAIEAIIKKPAVATPVTTGPPLTRRATPLASQKKSSAGPVIGVVAALLIIGGIAALLLSKKPEKPSTPEATQTAELTEPPTTSPEAEDFPIEKPKPLPATTQMREEVEAQEAAMAAIESLRADREKEEVRKKRRAEKKLAAANKSQETPKKSEPEEIAPVASYDHHAFLKRGRAYCVQNTQRLITEYQEDLVKNIEGLGREGRAILRDEEYLDRKTESLRKDNMELVIKKFAREGRLPKNLATEIPESLGALTWREGVVEREVRDALDKQNNLDLALEENLKPVAGKYIAGLRKEADRLESEGQTADAKILRSEATEAESTPHYFVSIAKGEYPLPPGLESNPAMIALKAKVTGHWKAEDNNAELVILSNGETFLPKPVQDGTWAIEEEQVFLIWSDRKEAISFPDEDPYSFSTYNHRARTTTIYRRLDRPSTSSQDKIVGSWIRRANDAVYNFSSNGTFNIIKWNTLGSYKLEDDVYKLATGSAKFDFTFLDDGSLQGVNTNKEGNSPFFLKRVE